MLSPAGYLMLFVNRTDSVPTADPTPVTPKTEPGTRFVLRIIITLLSDALACWSWQSMQPTCLSAGPWIGFPSWQVAQTDLSGLPNTDAVVQDPSIGAKRYRS